MDIRVTHLSMLSEFLNVDFNTNKISDSLNTSICKIMQDNNLSIPNDWILLFQANYNNGKLPLVSKNRVGSYPSDKMKYIAIVIPIPLKSEIEWGGFSYQYMYEKNHYDKLMRNFIELNIDYRNYMNRADFITACLKAGIEKAFEEGFTIGAVKIKAKITI